MLNTATPTLQMKISGVPLSSIKIMIVTIRSVNNTIVKGNADIEVDNDVVSAFLTQEEADKISGENYNVSILAESISGEDVSGYLKVMWVKRGSMSKAAGAGGGSDIDLSNYYTKQEVDVIISNIPGGIDGFSPIATVRKADGVSKITITDKNGTTEVKVFDGSDGLDGTTPHIGENGNWQIGTVDTGTKAEGIDGTDGKDGIDGFSPMITENEGNDKSTYKLDITTSTGIFTTPNLKGGGDGGGTIQSAIWKPIVSSGGELSWEKSDSEEVPESVNIKGAPGKDGQDGFSPSITENPLNTQSIYKLDIVTKDGVFTTPNLKGKDGSSGSDSGSGGLFAFEIREDGHLWVISDSETQANSFYIDDKGHLIYELEG